MDKNDILDYATETPGNTNRAVLGSMLDSFAGGGGDSTSDFVVNFTLGFEDDYPTVTADKTFAEITTAINNGDFVRGVLNSDNDSEFISMSMTYRSDQGGIFSIYFIGNSAWNSDDTTLFMWQIHISNDPDFGESWDINAYTSTRTPVFQ